MPSLIQTGPIVLGYPLAQGSNAIVALGTAAVSGPTNGLLQEDGTSYVLAENGDYIVQE